MPWLAAMKRGAMLVNTARGAVVDQEAVADAVDLAGDLVAGLEEVRPTSSPKEPGVIVAGGTDLYVQRPEEIPDNDVWVLPIANERPIWSEGDRIYLAATATAERFGNVHVLFNNCYRVYQWDLLTKMAAALGRQDEAARCRKRAAQIIRLRVAP